jgi:hypothetical protein
LISKLPSVNFVLLNCRVSSGAGVWLSTRVSQWLLCTAAVPQVISQVRRCHLLGNTLHPQFTSPPSTVGPRSSTRTCPVYWKKVHRAPKLHDLDVTWKRSTLVGLSGQPLPKKWHGCSLRLCWKGQRPLVKGLRGKSTLCSTFASWFHNSQIFSV